MSKIEKITTIIVYVYCIAAGLFVLVNADYIYDLKETLALASVLLSAPILYIIYDFINSYTKPSTLKFRIVFWCFIVAYLPFINLFTSSFLVLLMGNFIYFILDTINLIDVLPFESHYVIGALIFSAIFALFSIKLNKNVLTYRTLVLVYLFFTVAVFALIANAYQALVILATIA